MYLCGPKEVDCPWKSRFRPADQGSPPPDHPVVRNLRHSLALRLSTLAREGERCGNRVARNLDVLPRLSVYSPPEDGVRRVERVLESMRRRVCSTFGPFGLYCNPPRPEPGSGVQRAPGVEKGNRACGVLCEGDQRVPPNSARFDRTPKVPRPPYLKSKRGRSRPPPAIWA